MAPTVPRSTDAQFDDRSVATDGKLGEATVDD
jgi:hypothetical protein